MSTVAIPPILRKISLPSHPEIQYKVTILKKRIAKYPLANTCLNLVEVKIKWSSITIPG
jgi:hypothetical protein